MHKLYVKNYNQVLNIAFSVGKFRSHSPTLQGPLTWYCDGAKVDWYHDTNTKYNEEGLNWYLEFETEDEAAIFRLRFGI